MEEKDTEDDRDITKGDFTDVMKNFRSKETKSYDNNNKFICPVISYKDTHIKKVLKVWFKLNEGTEIAVKMAVGVSKPAVVGDCISQGTAGGALVSQANLDHGLEQYFKNSNKETYYGNVRTLPLSYQDDILK